MQCSDCGYISFKKEKACGACGFKFKKTAPGSQSLAGKESFSIFAGSPKVQSKDSPAVESVGLLEEQEPITFIDPETGDFNLDLAATSEETIEEAQIPSENTEYESMEFDLHEDIELEEVEGLGLEPLHATESLIIPEDDTTEVALKIDEPEETVSLEPALEIGEPEETVSLEPALEIGKPEETVSLEPVLEIGEPEETVSLEPALEIGEPEETVSLEPVLEIGEPEETVSLEPALEIGEPEETVSLEPALEIGEPEETVSLEPVLEIGEPESEEIALDLGQNEIALDLDDSPSIPPVPPVAAPLDEIELSLEIDDSDGPLTTQRQDIPDIEIEDLGLELESSDDPEPDKP
jgi:hypothetical protein